MSDQTLGNSLASNSDLLNRLEALENRCDALEKRVEELELRRKRDTKNHNVNAARFNEFKSDFQASKPHSRVDAFTVEELVLWSSYILKDSPRREILNHTEFWKRTKPIRKIIAYYTDGLKATGKSDDEINQLARIRTRAYLEFVLLAIEINGEKINFWQATSDWAINKFGSEVVSWLGYKNLDDTPLE